MIPGLFPQRKEEKICMRQSVRLLLAIAMAAAWVPAAVHAHFRLLEPASWLVESERGDPQKLAPCGADPKGTPSSVVGKAVGGSKLHL